MLSFKAVVGDIRHFFDAATGSRHSRVTLESAEQVVTAEGKVPKYSIVTTVDGEQATELRRLTNMVVSLETPEVAEAKASALATVQAQAVVATSQAAQVVQSAVVPSQQALVGDPHAQAAAVVASGAALAATLASAITPTTDGELPVNPENTADITITEVAAETPVDSGGGPTAGTSIGV